jgi:hypothetical protein
MRKYCILSFFILAISSISFSQEAVFKITRSYFRSDPFRVEFSAFLRQLISDPTLTNKMVEKRTDSSLFYFQGTYTTAFNPFFFKPKRIEIVLTELEIKLDSLTKDTIFTYELFAFANGTKEGSAEISKEFEKIFKHYKNSFSRNEYKENPPDKYKSMTYNFFDRFHGISPFSLSLYGPDEKQEICLIISIRLDTYNNMAMLPAPFLPPTDNSEEEDQ